MSLAWSALVSHWLSPAALAALSATSALVGTTSLAGASVVWPFVKATAEPSLISVNPALATVGSVWGSLDSAPSVSAAAASAWNEAAWLTDAFLTSATGLVLGTCA